VSEGTWRTVAALADPVRRSLYEYVRRAHRPVTREDAAQALAISRNLAAFHLDKLVEAEMLRARYQAPADQPRGRGRTPKVYEATGHGLALTVPQREYALVGEILADAIATDPADARTAAGRHAAARGYQVGLAAPPGRGGETGRAAAALTELGYEPRPASDGIVLDNCPFHAIATRHTELICGLNKEFIRGLLAGLGCGALRADLRPRPGGCCVRVTAV
jgi:predicted ArsR family transcriptional regulator